MLKAWSPKIWKSNEISWDGVFANHDRQVNALLNQIAPISSIWPNFRYQNAGATEVFYPLT
jgi:hypothetical protein